MSTIELGEIPTADGDQPAPTGSAGFDRRLVRQVAVALAVVLCAVTLAGSEVPRSHGLRPLWNIPFADAQGTTVTRDSLFVYRAADSATTITAYELATGAIRWQRGFDSALGYPQAAEAAGLLLIPAQGHLVQLSSADEGPAVQAETYEKTIAVSTATGEEVWRADGEPYTVGDGTALFTEFTPKATMARMRLVRLADGSSIWSRDTSGSRAQVALPMTGRPDKIVTATDAGEIKIYAYDSGSLVSSARIPWVEPRPGEGYFNDLSGTGDVLVVNRSRAEVFDLSVYRTDTMAELWRAADTNGYAFPCSDALCLNDGNGVVAYDPATGTRRWRVDGMANAWQLTDDRVVVGEGTETGRMQLIDAATGHLVGEPVEGTLAWNDHETGSALVLRATVSPQGRTAVTKWDLRTGRQWLLGTIAPVAGPPCTVEPNYLACIRGDTYEITAIR